jgi:two-component system cell cycle response regulator DivK
MTPVLIVEDNEMNRDMLTRRLQKRGYDVISAIDGPSGIAMARETSPDLILMDVALGAMDGWEATTILQADPKTRATPIVALTAHALESDRRRSIEVGCVDFETKPIQLAELIEKIEKHTAKKAA